VRRDARRAGGGRDAGGVAGAAGAASAGGGCAGVRASLHGAGRIRWRATTRAGRSPQGAGALSGDLFEGELPPAPDPDSPEPGAPLADRIRPRSFDELVGQDQLFASGSPLALMRDGRHLSSIILWGPPG